MTIDRYLGRGVMVRNQYPGEMAFVDERQRLIALACSIVGCGATAEDVVQESWLRWQTRSYPEAAAGPIFRQIVVNLARDWRRKEKREAQHLDAHRGTQTPVFDTEYIVITRDDLAQAIEALRDLPERTFAAFRMHRLDEMTYAEIARQLDISTPRAFQLVQRALVHVATRLDS
ncbi:MAG: sigma-70 family RNA polymerase sigma factor [Pseudomonadota bacterium]